MNRTLDSAVGWGTFQSTPPYPSRQFAFFVSNGKATQSASSPGKHRGTREETPSSWQLDVLGNVRMPWIPCDSPVEVRPWDLAVRPGSLREVPGVTRSAEFPDDRSPMGAGNLAGRSA